LKIRVLHLIKSLNRGGAEILLTEGLRFADRDRFELSYAYFHPKIDALVPTLSQQGVEVTCLGGENHVGMLARAPLLARHLRDRRIDLVHCHLPTAGVVGRLACRVVGVPVVYTEHNKPERYRRPTFLLNRWTYEMQAHVIAVSDSVRESIEAYIGARVPVTVIRNGVDAPSYLRTERERAAVRQRLGIADAAIVVGNVAALIPQKRLHDWIEAARRVCAMLPRAQVRFLLIGDGPERERLLALVAKNGLKDVVQLCGIHPDVRPFLAAFDIYMMSSAFEGLPVALLEAMAMRCVPVCTAVGGIPEVIVAGENGYLTPPGRPDELAARVVELASQPDRLSRLGTAARRTVSDDFRIDTMVASIEQLYLDVLQRAPGASAPSHSARVAMPI